MFAVSRICAISGSSPFFPRFAQLCRLRPGTSGFTSSPLLMAILRGTVRPRTTLPPAKGHTVVDCTLVALILAPVSPCFDAAFDWGRAFDWCRRRIVNRNVELFGCLVRALEPGIEVKTPLHRCRVTRGCRRIHAITRGSAAAILIALTRPIEEGLRIFEWTDACA